MVSDWRQDEVLNRVKETKFRKWTSCMFYNRDKAPQSWIWLLIHYLEFSVEYEKNGLNQVETWKMWTSSEVKSTTIRGMLLLQMGRKSDGDRKPGVAVRKEEFKFPTLSLSGGHFGQTISSLLLDIHSFCKTGMIPCLLGFSWDVRVPGT